MLEKNKSIKQEQGKVNIKGLKPELQSFLTDLELEDLHRLTELISALDIRVVQQPEAGLLMMTVKDSFETPFHLGEVLVTSAEVEYQGHLAQAAVMGDQPVKALMLAAVEAVCLANDTLNIRRIGDEIRRLREIVLAKREKEEALLNATRVQFSSMNEENVDFSTIG